MEGEPKIDPAWSRETSIRRDERGRWFHEGIPIETPAIERAFDRWIDRAEDGRYILRNEINWAYCRIEGAPVFVRRSRLEGDGLWLSLSDGREERLNPSTLRQGPDGALYCQVRGGALSALFEREAMTAFQSRLGEDAEGLFLELEGAVFRPKVALDPLEGAPA